MVISGETTGTRQEADTVIIKMGKAIKDDIKDLRRGEGKVFDKINREIQELKDSGEVSDNLQPIIIIFKQKGGLLG